MQCARSSNMVQSVAFLNCLRSLNRVETASLVIVAAVSDPACTGAIACINQSLKIKYSQLAIYIITMIIGQQPLSPLCKQSASTEEKVILKTS
jgi:hypothetical protein